MLVILLTLQLTRIQKRIKKETAANEIKFLENIVNGSVTYKESVYKIEFIKEGDFNVVRFYSEEKQMFDMHIENFMERVADKKITYENFDDQEARALLIKNSEFYFNYFFERMGFHKQN